MYVLDLFVTFYMYIVQDVAYNNSFFYHEDERLVFCAESNLSNLSSDTVVTFELDYDAGNW